MTVVTSSKDPRYAGTARRCSICDIGLCIPYVRWATESGNDLSFCGECCRHLHTNLMADMIHCTAITEFQRLGYHSQTLQRISRKEADDDAAKVDDVPW